jgi:hypothetical protein
MSLDVYLTLAGAHAKPSSGIFIREDGQTKEITEEEWNGRCPGVEPVRYTGPTSDGVVYSANITHNLNTMARESGLYDPLWRPEEVGIQTARQLIPILTDGLSKLKAEPDRFRVFNPKNGWGTYEGLVGFVERYLAACEQYPEAEVSVSR